MKITPDSSLFTALSSLPTPAEARKRSGGAGGEGSAFADKLAGDGKSTAARDELIRKALEDGRLRQAAVARKQQLAASAENGRLPDTAAPRGSVTREAPFADGGNQPKFVRLGQFVDIRV